MKNNIATIEWTATKEEDGEEIPFQMKETVEWLYWGLTIIHVPSPMYPSPIPMNRTVGICRKVDTGEVIEVEPELLKFKTNEQN